MLHHIRGRHLFFSVANWKNHRESFYHHRVVNQHQIFFGCLLIPGRARCKIDFCSTVHRTWRNRHLVLTWFQPSSSRSMPVPQNILSSSIAPPDWISAKQTVGVGIWSQFHPSSCAVPQQFQRLPVGWLLGWPLDWKSDLVRKNLGGTRLESEQNQGAFFSMFPVA